MSEIIEWHEAAGSYDEFKESKQQAQAVAEFLEEDCELHNGRDLQYWVDRTGKDLDWIIENGKNISPIIKEVVALSGDLDEVWDYDPFNANTINI